MGNTGYTGPLSPPAPVAPTVTVPQEILNKMVNHHITLNYVIVLILFFVLTCGGVGAYYGLKGYDKLMQRAEASEKLMVQYEQSWKQADSQYQKEATEHAADRAQWATQIAAANAKEAGLIQQLKDLNTKVDQSITAVLQPGKSAQEVFGDLKDSYKNTPLPLTLNVSADPATKEQLLTFPITIVQQFTATKLDRDRLASNVDNLNQQITTKNQTIDGLTKTNASLTTDFNALRADDDKLKLANGQCQDTVKKYKAVSVKTRWQKIWAGTKKGAEIAGALLAGYELGKHL
jgi:regulator of replication initiation timing